MAIHLSPPQAFGQEAHHGSALLDRVGNTPRLRLSCVARELEEEDIRRLGGVSAPLAVGDRLLIVPSIAGGRTT
jgi:molybdopterin converting factor small subunit